VLRGERVDLPAELLRIDNYRTLQDLVYTNLRELIISGHLAPGQKLVTAKLAAELGVSRMPVREALNRLQSEGLVTIVPHKETIVTAFSFEDVAEIYDIRTVLEGYAAGLCARASTPDQIERLKSLVSAAESLLAAGDLEGFKHCDNRFHHGVFDTCGSIKLAQLLSNLWDQCLYYRNLASLLKRNPHRSLQEHRDIVTALEARDADKAQEMILLHTRNSRDTLLEHLRSQQRVGPGTGE
jgi:DNA-binding GntR family transcriptional regulator